MASKDSTLIFSIGSQRISAARFTASGGGLALGGFDSVEISPDISTEGVRASQVGGAIDQLADAMGAQKGEVVRVVLSAQGVYTKWVPVPTLAGKSSREVIELEARQAVPFPLESARWGAWHGTVHGVPAAEALIAAVRGDAIAQVSAAVENAGLTMGVVEVSPFSLANAYRYNHPQSEEAVLLLDLGARAVSLIFIEGERVFLRTVNIGGFNLSAQIAKEFGLEIGQSEELKRSRGVVALGNQQVAEDEEQEALSKVIRQGMTRVHSEITRTLSLWRSQQGGSAPTRLVLAGGGAALPYTLEFLQEKMNLPIEYFNAFERIGVSGNMTPDYAAGIGYLAGDLVGAALAENGLSEHRLDILPEAVAQREDFKRRQPFLYAALGMLAAGALGLIGANLLKKARFEGVVEDNQASVAQMTNNSKKIEQIYTAKDDPATAEVNESGQLELQALVGRYEDAVRMRSYWVDLLQDFNSRFDSDVVWLTSWEPQFTVVDPTGKPMVDKEGKAVPAGDAAAQGGLVAITDIAITGLYRGGNTETVHREYNDLKQGGEGASPWFTALKDQIGSIEPFDASLSYGAAFSESLRLARPVPRDPAADPLPPVSAAAPAEAEAATVPAGGGRRPAAAR